LLISVLNKINRGLGYGFFVSLFLLGGCQETLQSPVFETDVSNISGLQIGMSETKTIALMGKPDQIENVFSGGDYAIFSYSGLTIDMSASDLTLDSPKVVSGIRSQSPEYCFKQEVCPGDTLESIMEKMGETEILSPQDEKELRLLYLLPDLETCWLWVFTEDNKVSSGISIACQP